MLARSTNYSYEDKGMKQLFLNVKDGSVKLIETPPPVAKENFVIAETMYSIVSAGTERSLTSFGGKNLLQKAMERPDQVKKVLEKVSTDGLLTTMDAAFNKLREPMPMGYSAVGRVISCGRGVTGIAKGDIVAMAGQAYHSEVNRVNKNLIAVIPAGETDYRQYAMCALGGIALEGIHQADVRPGETVAVIGLGLLGHILSRILNAYGCDVIAYDIADKTLPGTCLKAFIDSNDENAEEITKSFTRGHGVDKVIITAAADSNAPMELAAAIARDRAVICMVGVTQMNIDRRPYYQKELTFTIARSYGPGRYDASYEEKGVDYPIGQIRFTEGRNLEEFVRLISSGRLNLSDLITHEIAFEDAESAYEIITTNKNQEKYIGVILKYNLENEAKWNSLCSVNEKHKVDKDVITVGLIGAGNFARSTILPQMKANGHFLFRGLATTGGVSTGPASDVFPFDYVTNDYKRLLADEEINLIVVSTQHNSHAKFTIEALNAGKNVYCEKPLCLTLEELEAIEKAYHASSGELFCGLNRRHSPLVKEIKDKLMTDKIPAVYNYIVNAGFIPEDHWTQDEITGGGRIIGEACHFVDTIQYLDSSALKSLDITFALNSAYPKNDNAVITLGFASGAVGTIVYTSMGSKKYPKEQLQVFSNGTVYELDNYVKLTRYGNSKSSVSKLRQDKGIYSEYEYIRESMKAAKANDIIADAFTALKLMLEACADG